MRVASLFTAALASFGLTAALPVVERAPTKPYYQVASFSAYSYTETKDNGYYLSVQSKVNSPYRKFGYATCQIDLVVSEMSPVDLMQCNGNGVYMTWHKYLENDEFAGWELGISHPYHNKAGFLTVDYATKKFPKDQFAFKGTGKNRRRQYTGPKKFTMEVQS
jgi:hypothetical protein